MKTSSSLFCITSRTLFLLTLMATLITTVSCSTWRGAGKDVEKTGHAMEGK